MRLIIMFDLPVDEPKLLKEYIAFRRFLVNEGFIMMQKSIYTKLLLNSTNLQLLNARIKNNKPSHGIIQLLKITEKQFAEITYLTGEKQNKIEESDKRLVVL